MKPLHLIFETAVLLVNYTLIDLALCGLAMRFRTHWLYILILAGGVWAVGKLQEDLYRLLHRRGLSIALTVASLAVFALLAFRVYGPDFG